MSLTIGILAGGKSSRMGQDKANLLYGNETFLERLIGEFQPFGQVVLSAPKNKYETKVLTLEDTYANQGPLAGIYEILNYSKSEWTFITPIDMPLIDLEVLSILMKQRSQSYEAIFFQVHNQVFPIPGLYHNSVLDRLRTALELKELRLSAFNQGLAHKKIKVHEPRLIEKFKNINYREDYSLLEPLIFLISGGKENGKTTFIQKLVRNFSQLGLRVSVLKHDGHDFELNDSGTDTSYFRQAGAIDVGIYSSKKFQLVSPKTHLSSLVHYFFNYDILIIEGLKNTSLPKFEVFRENIGERLISNPENLLGVITDSNKRLHSQQFDLNQASSFCKFLLSNHDLVKKSRFIELLEGEG